MMFYFFVFELLFAFSNVLLFINRTPTVVFIIRRHMAEVFSISSSNNNKHNKYQHPVKIWMKHHVQDYLIDLHSSVLQLVQVKYSILCVNAGNSTNIFDHLSGISMLSYNSAAMLSIIINSSSNKIFLHSSVFFCYLFLFSQPLHCDRNTSHSLFSLTLFLPLSE